MKCSRVIQAGIWQFEFVDEDEYTGIAVAQWKVPPLSTLQWVTIANGEYHGNYRLEGTCIEDIRVVPWVTRPHDFPETTAEGTQDE